MKHQITIDELQRQMIILALAELSIARPGWLDALEECARCFDAFDPDDPHKEPVMFKGLRQNHHLTVNEALSKE